MDSLRSIHARVAALARYRKPTDPEFISAREELASCLARTRALRTRLGSVPPASADAALTSAAERSARV